MSISELSLIQHDDETNEEIELRLWGRVIERREHYVNVPYVMLKKLAESGLSQFEVGEKFGLTEPVICQRYKFLREIKYYTRKRSKRKTNDRPKTRHADTYQINKAHFIHKAWGAVA